MKRKIIYLTIIYLLVLIFIGYNVHANVQTRPGTSINFTRNIDEQFINIRKMESSGQVLGLNAEISENGTETTSNNIDSHMIKKTELGVVVTLVNSQYGIGYNNIGYRTNYLDNINNYTKDYSTTKNMSGIMGINSYYVDPYYPYNNGHINLSATYGNKNTIGLVTTLRTVLDRYINLCDSTTSKAGDANEYIESDGKPNTILMLYNNRFGYQRGIF